MGLGVRTASSAGGTKGARAPGMLGPLSLRDLCGPRIVDGCAGHIYPHRAGTRPLEINTNTYSRSLFFAPKLREPLVLMPTRAQFAEHKLAGVERGTAVSAGCSGCHGGSGCCDCRVLGRGSRGCSVAVAGCRSAAKASSRAVRCCPWACRSVMLAAMAASVVVGTSAVVGSGDCCGCWAREASKASRTIAARGLPERPWASSWA
jgi:hypothetical protein